jgi:hypothetical protein
MTRADFGEIPEKKREFRPKSGKTIENRALEPAKNGHMASDKPLIRAGFRPPTTERTPVIGVARGGNPGKIHRLFRSEKLIRLHKPCRSVDGDVRYFTVRACVDFCVFPRLVMAAPTWNSPRDLNPAALPVSLTYLDLQRTQATFWYVAGTITKGLQSLPAKS